DDLPTGWLACDGTNGTPELEDVGGLMYVIRSNAEVDTEAPLFDSGLLGSDGQTLVLAFSEAVVADSDDDEDWVLTASGGAAAIAYESGSGTSELTYSASRVIEATETLSLAYTQPGGGV